MKTFKFARIAFLAAGALVPGAVAYSQTTPTMKANIPFAFRAANKVLPAGEYTISNVSTRNGSPIVLLRANGVNGVYELGTHNDPHLAGAPTVTFRCGSICELTAIRTSAGTTHYSTSRPKAEERPKAQEKVALVTVPLRTVNGD
jgi:hypothetical protein